MESDNQAQESVTLGKRPLLDETTKSGTNDKKQKWMETEEPVAGSSHDIYLTDSEPDLMSTQDNTKRDKWLEEIRDSQGDYEQEVISGHEADPYKRFNSCTKNPGHKQFIDVNTFRSEHLPQRYRSDQKLIDFVRAQADVTCLMKVPYVSPDRPETSPFYKNRGRSDFSRSATGWVNRVRVYTEEDKGEIWYRSCQCQTCQQSSEPRSEWATVRIHTARHVVCDKSEAEASECYFSYDNTQQKLSGTHLHRVSSSSACDVTEIYYVTHDLVLARKLKDMCHLYDRLCDDVKQKYSPFSRVVPDRVVKDKNDEKNKVQLPSDKSKDDNPTGHGVQDHLNHGEDDDNDDDDMSYKPEHNLVIITSHPHGCAKMVTLGHLTDRITEPYRRYEYNTATCPGSSGAQVFVLSHRHWLYHTHAHSRHVRGQGPDQINGSDVAWY